MKMCSISHNDKILCKIFKNCSISKEKFSFFGRIMCFYQPGMLVFLKKCKLQHMGDAQLATSLFSYKTTSLNL